MGGQREWSGISVAYGKSVKIGAEVASWSKDI